MKNLLLALFVLWFLSLQFYLPLTIGIMLGAAFAAVSGYAVAQQLARLANSGHAPLRF